MPRPTRSPPSERASSTRAGARASSRSRTPTGCGRAAPASRRPTPAANRGSPGRRRCTRCRPCSSSGSTRRREAARRAIALVAEHGRWEHAGQRYFDGEVEPCINGRTIETGAYFGVDVAAIVERILGERLDDGGWNCEAENGSVRSSFDTTINVLDGLLEFERATGGSADGARGPPQRGGVPARARPVPPQEHRARSPIRRISTSRSRTTGTTTCCARSTTSAGRARTRIPGWRRRSRSCGPSGSPTAGGCSTASIPVASTSTSRAASERRVAGTRSARSGCSTGGTEGHARRRDASAEAIQDKRSPPGETAGQKASRTARRRRTGPPSTARLR